MTNKIDYGFGAKNNWRRQVWNVVSQKLIINKRDAICLYLANETDIDFQIATQKGFNKNNLIAVNKDQQIVDMLRKKGRLAFCGDIFDGASNFPSNMEIDFLHLDLCSGLQKRVLELPWIVLSGRLSTDCIVCVNLQRGRDSETNQFRESINSNPNITEFFGDVGKHRGKHFLISLVSWFAHFSQLYKNGFSEIKMTINAEPNNDGLYWSRFETWIKLIKDPVFLSYKSRDNRTGRSGVTMDSVIFQMPFSMSCEIYNKSKNKKARDSLKAISAVRTMRRR